MGQSNFTKFSALLIAAVCAISVLLSLERLELVLEGSVLTDALEKAVVTEVTNRKLMAVFNTTILLRNYSTSKLGGIFSGTSCNEQ